MDHNYDIMDEDSLSYCGQVKPKWRVWLFPSPLPQITIDPAPDGVDRKLKGDEKEPRARWAIYREIGIIAGGWTSKDDPWKCLPYREMLGWYSYEEEAKADAEAKAYGRACIKIQFDGWRIANVTWMNVSTP